MAACIIIPERILCFPIWVSACIWVNVGIPELWTRIPPVSVVSQDGNGDKSKETDSHNGTPHVPSCRPDVGVFIATCKMFVKEEKC